jgi:hypothetical protein
MSRTSPRARKRKPAPAPAGARTRTVWTALLLSMTTVGGFLYILQGGTAPRLDGLALPAMVAAAGPSSIEAVFKTRQPLAGKKWQGIVIHHSGELFGSPAALDARARSMNLDGLGYHFVIGNGSGMDDGEVHVGYRWMDQLPGAHVAGAQGDWYNRNTIAICLVGDGRRKPFTQEQMRRAVQLVSALAERLDIPQDHIYLHSQLTRTEDPGQFFPEAAFREQLAKAR